MIRTHLFPPGCARRTPLLAVAFALALTALAPPAMAGGEESAAPGASLLEPVRLRPTANQLLRLAVANQEILPASGYFTWMDHVERRRGSVTKRMVMTPAGILSRMVSVNGRPLTAEERRSDDARIQRLLDPEEMRAKAGEQQQLQQRIERLLRALPDAFDCAYQPAPAAKSTARTVATLSCSPKPAFSPPSHEAQLLTGMNAVIAIDLADRRMTRFEGTLFQDVTFAWGFLARLNRGGYLELQQERLPSGQWRLTRMELRVDGRMIMVKPLHLERSESAWGYRAVPAMSVAEALEYLRRAPENEPLPAH